MAYKVVIDAGHGGADFGATYNGRKEKDDNLDLALAVGNILSQNGIDVVYTRTTDIYQTPFEKATLANEAGADFFISFHRNSSPESNQYEGVETLVYDKSGQKLDMAENINGALGELGFREIGVKARPGLVVLRRTKMPAVLGTLDEEALENQTENQDNFYRVQTGSFRNREHANNMLYTLQDQGYPAFLLYEDGLFKVQVGAFKNLSNAVKMEQALRKSGYSTWIVSGPASY